LRPQILTLVRPGEFVIKPIWGNDKGLELLKAHLNENRLRQPRIRKPWFWDIKFFWVGNLG
jgi:hypothetical protein